MSQFVFKMPDLGEGTVEAEIVAWHAKVGDVVTEDQVMVEVMTDKAAVEVPAPVSGRVVSTTGAPGDKVPVGAALIVFETDTSDGAAAPASNAAAASLVAPSVTPQAPIGEARTATPGRIMTSPANRRRAREAGIDLATVHGSGPHGRIVRGDLSLDAVPSAAVTPAARKSVPPAGAVEEIKVIGLRRMIAERMSEAKRTIPHFAYVDEVDVTELEALRKHLNGKLAKGEPGLTYLPFVMAALTRVLEVFPQCNACYDATRGVLLRHAAVHIGVATQTPDGLKVPVVRDAQVKSVWELGAEIRRLSERARTNKASREELTGSTITVTSLGKLGGIASTPIINMPEVAIIGLNKAIDRPMVVDGTIVVRRMMNLSSSFDHRFVDGYDAAAMIQMLKEHLEHPATIFLPR